MLPTTSQVLPYEDARRLAHEHAWREKSLVYVTRGNDLLVLEHTDEYPGAGVQVPAGGVEPGETPEAAAARELFEETGLQPTTSPVYVESHWWTNEEAPSRIRHYYWQAVPVDTPNSWSHVVSGGEGDLGMTFHLSFRHRSDPDLTPGYGWEAALTRLSLMMKQR